jgi:hypothetical protein
MSELAKVALREALSLSKEYLGQQRIAEEMYKVFAPEELEGIIRQLQNYVRQGQVDREVSED